MKFVQDLKRDEREIKSLKERSRIIFLFISIMFCIGLFKILQLSILDNTEYLDDSDNKYNIPNGIHEISNKNGNVIIKVSRSIKPKIGEYA